MHNRQAAFELGRAAGDKRFSASNPPSSKKERTTPQNGKVV
jgi:hypothetical protein